MNLQKLQTAITTPFFTTVQVQKLFPEELPAHINVQLARLAAREQIIPLKRGLFVFPGAQIDDFSVANLLYPQSYVSLESALNAYGIIPDIPSQVTSISPITSKTITTPHGTFLYSKIAAELYFGFTQVASSVELPHSHISTNSYRIAEPEKALLDYIYIRKIRNLEENRVSLEHTSPVTLRKYAQLFPNWVRKVINE